MPTTAEINFPSDDRRYVKVQSARGHQKQVSYEMTSQSTVEEQNYTKGTEEDFEEAKGHLAKLM